MRSNTTFTVHPRARAVPIGSLLQREVTTLLAGGIVNPFGPTLTALVVDGEFSPGPERPVVLLTLNPFSQSASEVGVVEVGETWIPPRHLAPFFDVGFGSCPTLLLPSALLDAEEATEVHARFLRRFSDGYTTLQKVRAFPGDPFARVQHDVDASVSVLRRARKPGTAPAEARALTAAESKELATALLDPASIRKELQAFFFAWKGAIEFQGAGSMTSRAMSLDAFSRAFALLALSCTLPEFGAE
jgi:hypothetical protein